MKQSLNYLKRCKSEQLCSEKSQNFASKEVVIIFIKMKIHMTCFIRYTVNSDYVYMQIPTVFKNNLIFNIKK